MSKKSINIEISPIKFMGESRIKNKYIVSLNLISILAVNQIICCDILIIHDKNQEDFVELTLDTYVKGEKEAVVTHLYYEEYSEFIDYKNFVSHYNTFVVDDLDSQENMFVIDNLDSENEISFSFLHSSFKSEVSLSSRFERLDLKRCQECDIYVCINFVNDQKYFTLEKFLSLERLIGDETLSKNIPFHFDNDSVVKVCLTADSKFLIDQSFVNQTIPESWEY